jgi:hypothetical protein
MVVTQSCAKDVLRGSSWLLRETSCNSPIVFFYCVLLCLLWLINNALRPNFGQMYIPFRELDVIGVEFSTMLKPLRGNV